MLEAMERYEDVYDLLLYLSGFLTELDGYYLISFYLPCRP